MQIDQGIVMFLIFEAVSKGQNYFNKSRGYLLPMLDKRSMVEKSRNEKKQETHVIGKRTQKKIFFFSLCRRQSRNGISVHVVLSRGCGVDSTFALKASTDRLVEPRFKPATVVCQWARYLNPITPLGSYTQTCFSAHVEWRIISH